MTNKKGKSIGYLFLGLSLISAILAASLFFYKTDKQLYSIASSAPNALPQKFVTFLKDNERWKAIISFAELYSNATELYTDELPEEIRTALDEITNSASDAKEQRKTLSYWKKEGIKTVMLKKGDDAPQETASQVASFFVDMWAGDYITLIDSGNKFINNESEEIDKFNTVLSAIGATLSFTTVASAGTAAPVTTPNHILINVLKKSVNKMKSKLRNDFLIQLNNIRKDTSLLSRYKSLTTIAVDSPEIAIWLLSIPNDLEQGERLWNLLSNSYSKKEMKNVIKQGTMLLTFCNNQDKEIINTENINGEQESEILPTNSINNNQQTEEPESVNNVTDTPADKGVLNKTIDYLGKKKDELLNKDTGSSEEGVVNVVSDNNSSLKPKKRKKMFEESEMIRSLDEIISVLEIMDQHNRMSAQDLFFALCYGQQGLDALKQNRLSEFFVCRDDIIHNSFESKAKLILIQYRNVILGILCFISLLFLAIFISLNNKRIARGGKNDG